MVRTKITHMRKIIGMSGLERAGERERESARERERVRTDRKSERERGREQERLRDRDMCFGLIMGDANNVESFIFKESRRER